MKRLLPILLLCTCLPGCTFSSKSLGGGYRMRTMQYFSWEPGGVAESLYFRGPYGDTRIWPWGHIAGPVLVEQSTALFIGTTSEGEDKLFATRDGAHLMDVGDPILALEAQRQSSDIPAFLREHQLHMWDLKPLPGGVELLYSRSVGVNNPPVHLSLTWAELSTIMRHVEAEGRLRKDGSGIRYWQIDFK